MEKSLSHSFRYEDLMAALKDDRKDVKKNSHPIRSVYQKKRGEKI